MKFYTHISLFFLIWFLSLIFISYLGFLTLPHSGNFDKDFINAFSNWDGGHFLGIAEFGYSEKFQYAFFPLYPILIRLLTDITYNYLFSALVISFISFFLGIQVLYKLLLLDYDKKVAEKVILYILAFPTSFYFLAAYSEGLFFLLVVCAFYFLKTNKIFWATVFVTLASATRVVGLALVFSFIVYFLTTKKIDKNNWFILLSPLGFLIYCLFLYIQVGDLFYFISAQLHWQRNITVPAVSFWQTLKSLSQTGFIKNNFTNFLDLIFAIFGLGFGIRGIRFLPSFYSVFLFTALLVPFFTPTLSSIPRFLLPLFPLFILLTLIKNRYFHFAYQLISIMLLGIFTILFINGYWVS